MTRDLDVLTFGQQVYNTVTRRTDRIAGWENGTVRKYRLAEHNRTYFGSELIRTDDPDRVIPGRSRV